VESAAVEHDDPSTFRGMTVLITAGGVDSLPQLRELWLQMVHHHRDVVGGRVGVVDDDSSWAATGEKYASWFADDAAMLLLARDDDGVLGYLMCHLDSTPARTFDLGDLHADIDSLVVDTRARRAGVGTALLNACRGQLIDRGVVHCTIGVVAGNDRAESLYARSGFQPHYLSMIATLS
jgi:ribosomal protein S18 acetylase RimI-like enzyme